MSQQGQAMVEYVLTFAVIAGLAVFGSKFFTELHVAGGSGTLDRHHQTAMDAVVGKEIPPIYAFYGDGTNRPPTSGDSKTDSDGDW